MTFFWPSNPKAEPRLVGRLGRVLHWLIVAGAAGCALYGLNMLFDGDGVADVTWAERMTGLGTIFFGGGGILIAGRAVRYILSGE